MLIQNKIIQNVKDKSIQDEVVVASMMYGSFTKGEGDEYSDVEFYIFITDDRFEQFNSKQWIAEIYPVDLIFYNEYGTEVVIFSNLIRGEFHFMPESKIDIIQAFKPTGVFPDTASMFIYDATSKLKSLLDGLGGPGPNRMTNENVNFAFNNFVNAWLMGVNVLRRGELARSLEALTQVQKYVLQLMRLKENTVERWLNSTKNLENDLSLETYRDYTSITSTLNEEVLKNTYKNSLDIVQELSIWLKKHYQFDIDDDIIQKLQHYLSK